MISMGTRNKALADAERLEDSAVKVALLALISHLTPDRFIGTAWLWINYQTPDAPYRLGSTRSNRYQCFSDVQSWADAALKATA